MTELQELCKRAIDKFGALSQMDMMVEECAECIAAIEHFKRLNRNKHDPTEVIDELVDVEIVLTQMKLIFGGDVWEDIHTQKVDRLKKLLR